MVQLKHETDRAYNDFDAKTDITTQITGSKQYHKPVVVLTDRATISAGEFIALHMKSFSQVTHIGTKLPAISQRRAPESFSRTAGVTTIQFRCFCFLIVLVSME
ncbi:MAG: S41 family peptidase [Chryseolinea sp.]